ncbi:cytochrome P450 [Bradyrhizobium diazoefficiens]|uniref:cytochrome P450 n=1 Tax=Bradyrhizobium diazoefficiens TaxID=1355477 RepID=UPI003D9B2770
MRRWSAYLPFGLGPRTCIGSSFALQEATIVLAVLMRRFDLNLMPRQAPLSLPDLGPIVGSIAKVRLLPAEPPGTVQAT